MACLRTVACFVLACVPGALADVGFCGDGAGLLPDVEDDGDHPSVDVILAQAALMSVNGSQLFGRINWYHTALVFRQNQSSTGEAKYWTLEFDSAASGNFFDAIFPQIGDDKLTWGNLDSRFCLREGLYWGRDHWKKTFETVMQLTKNQLHRTLSMNIGPMNASYPGTGSQYQTFAVQAHGQTLPLIRKHGPPKGYMLIHDLTCGDGAAWFLFHAATTNNVPIKKGFRMHVTQVVFNAHHISPLNVSVPEDWDLVLKTYKQLVSVKTDPFWKKPLDALLSLPVHALYDANTKSYWRIHGNRAPYVHFLYKEISICSPTTWDVPECLEYLPEDVDFIANKPSNLYTV